jgi:hypothetical protein
MLKISLIALAEAESRFLQKEALIKRFLCLFFQLPNLRQARNTEDLIFIRSQ